jgi:hypothetical protein
MTALDGAKQDDIRGYERGMLAAVLVELGRLGGVTARQRNIIAVGKSQKSVEEACNPAFARAWSVEFGRDGEGQKGRDGACSHGRDVAQSASQTTVADYLRNMPVTPEVDLLEREVSGDDEFVSRGDAQECGIIADANAKSAFWPEGPIADGGDQGALSGGELPSWIWPSGPRFAGFHREAQG